MPDTDFVKLILKRGGRWTDEQIEKIMVQEYGVECGAETTKERLAYYVKKGNVQSAPVNIRGKVVFQFWWIETDSGAKKRERVTAAQLMKKCREAIETYPYDHPLLVPIMEQYQRLDRIKDKEKTFV